jgi:hypothetical protein
LTSNNGHGNTAGKVNGHANGDGKTNGVAAVQISQDSCFSDMDQTLTAAVEIAQRAEAHELGRFFKTARDLRRLKWN